MAKQLLKLVIGVYLLLIYACSSDEGNSSNSANPYKITIHSQELVVIEFEQPLSNDQYTGQIGQVPVHLSKLDENNLVFLVPDGLELGKQTLNINSLGGFSREYNLEAIALPSSPEVIYNQFINDLNQMKNKASQPEDQAILTATVSSLNAVFENASAENQLKMANAYYVNKAFFNSSSQGKFTGDQLKYFNQYSFHVVKMGTYAIGAALAVPYGYHTPIILGMAVGHAILAYEAHAKLQEVTYSAIGVEVAGFFKKTTSDTQDTEPEYLVFTDDQERELTFRIKRSTISAADRNSTNRYYRTFFNSLDNKNRYIQKFNDGILWCNENVPFCNIPTLSMKTVRPEPDFTMDNENASIMQKINFSITHNNLQLVTATVDQSGKLKAKIKVTGNPQSNEIISNLRYTYSDEFSSISNQFPIKVTRGFSLADTWSLAEFEGQEAEVWHYDNYSCPGQAEDIYFRGSGTFTSNSFSITIHMDTNYTEYSSSCGILNSEFTPDADNFQFQGQYNMSSYQPQTGRINTSGVTARYDGDPYTVQSSYLQVVDPDTIILHLVIQDSDGSWTEAVVLHRN